MAELVIEDKNDLEKLPERLNYYGGDPFFLGQGSNLLVREGELPLVIVKVKPYRKIEIFGQEKDKILVRVQAGERLSKLLGFCVKNGLSGLEGLTGIPGSAGGAVMMNAGSFGATASDCLHSVSCWINGNIKTYKSTDLNPSYRKMEFPEKESLVTEIIFALTHCDFNVIYRRMSLNFFKKKSRQPITAWSGGCAFKNPLGSESAGKLLDMAGFRGKELGGMAFSSMHANFLINTGKGSSDAAFDLMALAQEKVRQEFGIVLESELKIIS